MINLECLCSTADVAPEVNGFAEECWKAGLGLRVCFPRGLSPEGPSVLPAPASITPRGCLSPFHLPPVLCSGCLNAQHCHDQGRD